MKNLKIALVGQPNTGKSSLFNSLVGPKVTVSNYPGTTVDVSKAEKQFEDKKIEFVDTPGIYSISDRSEEEKVTEHILFRKKIDGAIVIVDATSLGRSLYMALQILEAGIPVVLALNFVEEGEDKGILIDSERLEEILGIPVIPINPLTGRGVDELLQQTSKIREIPKLSFQVEYDDHLEEAIQKVSKQVKDGELPEKFIALRALEEDEDFYKYLESREEIDKVRKSLKEHPEISKDISVTRFGTASWIAERVTQVKPMKKKKPLGEKIDNILLKPVSGPVTTLLSFIGIFGVLLILGNKVQYWLTILFEKVAPTTSVSTPLLYVLVKGLNGLTAGIAIALPYVFLFYLLLGLMEDVGLLSRFIVNLDRFLRKIKLPGKSFIPLALGLGCTAPATRATRVLSSKREQFQASTFFAFVPCSSRIAIIMGIVGFYGSTLLAFSIFFTLFFAGLMWAFLRMRFTDLSREPLLLELPPYRKPSIENVFVKSWVRMKDFVYIVIPLLMAGGIFYGFLELFDIPQLIIGPLSPITSWLGLPKPTIIPLAFGFLQKDLTGPMLLTVLGSNLKGLTMLQIYSFGLASTIGIPCIIALGMQWKEFGWKRSMLLTILSIAYGFFFAGLAWRIVFLIT